MSSLVNTLSMSRITLVTQDVLRVTVSDQSKLAYQMQLSGYSPGGAWLPDTPRTLFSNVRPGVERMSLLANCWGYAVRLHESPATTIPICASRTVPQKLVERML
jgi:hypothetical protein